MLMRKTLSQQLCELLRNEITGKLEPGTRLQTDIELAKRFKVSVPTVREALTVLAREGMISRQRKRGTFVLDFTAKRHIAILTQLDLMDQQTTYFFRRLAQCLRRQLRERGLRAQFYIGEELAGGRTEGFAQPEFMRDLEENRIDSVIVAEGLGWPDLTAALASRNLVTVGGCANFEYYVSLDQLQVMKQAVKLLADAGCRKLAMVMWQPRHGQMHLAFEAMVKELGLTTMDGWSQSALHPTAVGAGWEDFVTAWSTAKTKPDGLVVLDEVLCADVAKAIVALKIQVPKQLKIVTHATAGSGFHLPFPATVLESSPEEQAQIMVDMLLRLRSGQPVPEKEVAMPLRVVESVPEKTAAVV